MNMKDILNPLPAPPKGFVWNCDEETRTWSIQKDENYDNEDDNSSDGSLPSVHSPGIPHPVNGKDYGKEYAPPSYDEFEENSSAVQQKTKLYVEHVVMPTDTLQVRTWVLYFYWVHSPQKCLSAHLRLLRI